MQVKHRSLKVSGALNHAAYTFRSFNATDWRDMAAECLQQAESLTCVDCGCDQSVHAVEAPPSDRHHRWRGNRWSCKRPVEKLGPANDAPIEVQIEVRAAEILASGVFGHRYEHMGYASAMQSSPTKATDDMLETLPSWSQALCDWHAGWLAWEIENT